MRSVPLPDYAPALFFVLRTPLLPFSDLVEWGTGLHAPNCGEDAEQLPVALNADRSRLRGWLHDLLARPEVAEAIFVASPDLETALSRWRENPDGDKGQRAERALVRYVQRMAGRATPFGLFSGCSTGSVTPAQIQSCLALGPRTAYQRHTRLDMDYLFALTETLGHDPVLIDAFCYRPNSSLYRAVGRLRYAEARLVDSQRTYHLVAVEDTPYLDVVLERAQQGATVDDLIRALVAVDVEIVPGEAEEFIIELIAGQLLVPDLVPAVTGSEPIHGLIEQLRGRPITAPFATLLEQTDNALADMDAAGLGIESGYYRAIGKGLSALPAPVALSRLFQVDMIKPAPQARLGAAVGAEIARGVELLHRLVGAQAAPTSLDRFRERYVARYDQRETPLVEALDEEIGVGFDEAGSSDIAPLLAGLDFPPTPDEQTAGWGAREQWFLRKLAQVWRTDSQTLELTETDLAALDREGPPKDRLPLPDAFAVIVMIAAASNAALDRGDFRILVEAVSGPSGARLLGRFCHADPELQRLVAEHLTTEAALEPDALFAEIVHLPEGRIGNVICRPVLRDYEIPYLGHSGAAAEHQIPITDLLVSVVNGEVILRSQRFGRRVIPRLTTAHNFGQRSLGVYRFLASLQSQGVASSLRWDWGALADADFLPRVTHGRLVLARARWRIDQEEIRRLTSATGAEQYRIVQAWRAQRNFPRHILLVERDNLLPVDLDNLLSIEAFADELKGRVEARLEEMFPGPDELCTEGPEGRFVHEIIVPFARRMTGDEIATDRSHTNGDHMSSPPLLNRPVNLFTRQPDGQPSRSFDPGSEWLYVKLYTGTTLADQVLCEVIGPVARAAIASGAADSWFFIRFADPDWHLRVRFHGQAERLHAEVLPQLQDVIASFQQETMGLPRIWRVQLDSYEREIERYGGLAGTLLAERLFCADSEAVIAMIEMLEGDAGADIRWRLALRGIDMLLNDMAFSHTEKQKLMRRLRDGCAHEFRVGSNMRKQLGEKHRRERQRLEALLNPDRDGESELAPALALLHQRSAQLRPVVASLHRAANEGSLTRSLADLAASYVHMHANRLLHANQRAQELVLYELLDRYYLSLSAQMH